LSIATTILSLRPALCASQPSRRAKPSGNEEHTYVCIEISCTGAYRDAGVSRTRNGGLFYLVAVFRLITHSYPCFLKDADLYLALQIAPEEDYSKEINLEKNNIQIHRRTLSILAKSFGYLIRLTLSHEKYLYNTQLFRNSEVYNLLIK